MKNSQVIAVDLVGTLTLTDTLHESVLTLVRSKPYFLLLLPFWLLQGIAHLKQKVTENSELDVTMLPYNQPFIDWLKEEKLRGKKIVLSTAANEKIAIKTVKKLEAMVMEMGGRLYLTKDAVMQKNTFKVTYPNWEKFEAIRKQYGAIRKFNSTQSKRLGLA